MVLAEFIAKVSRLSPKRYVIYIPKAVRPTAEQLHGSEVKVILLKPDEQLYPTIKKIEEYGYVSAFKCNDTIFVQLVAEGTIIASKLFKDMDRDLELPAFLYYLANKLRNADEKEKNVIATILENLAIHCLF